MVIAWLDLPPLGIVATLIVCYGLTGVLLHWLSFHALSRHFVGSLKGMVTPFFVTANSLFALMIAFLAAGVWESHRAATGAVLHERDGVASVLELASTIPSQADRLRQQLETYVRSVLESEWVERPNDHGSRQTDAALLELLRVAASRDVAEAAGPAVQAALLNAVQRISTARTNRLGLTHAHGDTLRWTAVLLLALLTQVSVAIAHLEARRSQAVALTLSTAAAVTVLGLVAMTERPFDGANQVSPEPLRRVIASRMR